MKIELNALFGDILQCRIDNEKASVYVLLDGIRYISETSPNQYLLEEVAVFYKLGPGAPGTQNRFELVDLLQKNVGQPQRVDPRGHILQQVKKMGRVLKKIHVGDSDEVFVVTWDHGSGFGIFREASSSPPTPTMRMPIDDQLEKYPALKTFWDAALGNAKVAGFMERKRTEKPSAVLEQGGKVYNVRALSPNGRGQFFVDFLEKNRNARECRLFKGENGTLLEYTGSLTAEQQKQFAQYLEGNIPLRVPVSGGDLQILMNHELAEALNYWLKGRKVSVLLMLNCWMMNLHTMYSLRNTVQYLVAPQGDIDNPGYNYHDILLSIYGASGHLSARDLAIGSVKLSHNSFMKSRAKYLNREHPKTLEYRSIFNVRLDKSITSSDTAFMEILGQFKAILEYIYTTLKNAPDGMVADALQYVRELSFDFTDRLVPMVDLPNFLYYLSMATMNLSSVPMGSSFPGMAETMQKRAESGAPMIKPRYLGRQCYITSHYKPATAWLTGQLPSGYSIFFPNGAFPEEVTPNAAADPLMHQYLAVWRDLVNLTYQTMLIP